MTHPTKKPKTTQAARSPWIDGWLKPVRKGEYERRGVGIVSLPQRWTGRRWEAHFAGGWDCSAMQFEDGHRFQWRGLAHPPTSKGGEK